MKTPYEVINRILTHSSYWVNYIHNRNTLIHCMPNLDPSESNFYYLACIAFLEMSKDESHRII